MVAKKNMTIDARVGIPHENTTQKCHHGANSNAPQTATIHQSLWFLGLTVSNDNNKPRSKVKTHDSHNLNGISLRFCHFESATDNASASGGSVIKPLSIIVYIIYDDILKALQGFRSYN